VPDLKREHRQHGALLARAKHDQPVIEAHLDRPKEKQIHTERRPKPRVTPANSRSTGE
jgi:hypothetical protein